MLTDLLTNATVHQSAEAAEEVIAALAYSLNANVQALREYAKQIGIKLKRKPKDNGNEEDKD